MAGVDDRVMLSIPSNPQYLSTLRAFFSSLLEALEFASTEVSNVVLAVHEACANVIEHCYQGDTGQRIDVTVSVVPEAITIEIQDYGGRQDVARFKPRALDDVRPRGLGTYFMHSLMDDVTFNSSDTGTLLRMTKRRSASCKSP